MTDLLRYMIMTYGIKDTEHGYTSMGYKECDRYSYEGHRIILRDDGYFYLIYSCEKRQWYLEDVVFDNKING